MRAVGITYPGQTDQLASRTLASLTKYRPYDPVAGRWLSRDPLGEASDPIGNLYVYVGGNPISITDPTGLFTALVGGGVSGAAPTGAEASAGIAVNPGLFGQQADVGVFETGGVTAGVNVSADAFVGYVKGGIANVGGQTINENFGIGIISVTLFHDPTTGELLGGLSDLVLAQRHWATQEPTKGLKFTRFVV